MDDLEQQLLKYKNDCLETLLNNIKQNTPVNTGKLRDGWKIQGDNIINDIEYCEYVEFGTIKQRPVGFIRKTLLDIQ